MAQNALAINMAGLRLVLAVTCLHSGKLPSDQRLRACYLDNRVSAPYQ